MRRWTLGGAALLALSPCVGSQVIDPPGRIMALRAGTSETVQSYASAYFLDVINTASGAVERTIPLPTASSAGVNAILAYGMSTAEGMIGLSGDGTRLVIAGYTTTLEFDFPSSSSWEEVPRAVATVTCDGTVTSDTAVNTTSFSAGNLRHAATFDGSFFYLSTEQDGLIFVRRGATSPPQRIDSPAFVSPRALAIEFDADAQRYQLYATMSGAGMRGISALGEGLPFYVDGVPAKSTLLPGFVSAPPAGNPQQWVWENSDSLYLAETGISNYRRSGPGSEWVLQFGSPRLVPARPDDPAGVSPAVRGLIGRREGDEFVLYMTVQDPLGLALPRILSYTPAIGESSFRTVALSPSLGSPYRGVAFPPSCTPRGGGSTPVPLPTPTVQPSPAGPPVAALATNVTAHVEGSVIGVIISNTAPSTRDFIAIFSSASANPALTAPIRVIDIARSRSGSAYLSNGTCTVAVKVPTLPGGLAIKLMRAPTGTDTSAAPFPGWNSWLGVRPTVLATVTVALAQPFAPVRVRILPGEASGTMRVAWTTAETTATPTVQWGFGPGSGGAPNLLAGSSAGTAAASLFPSSVCSDNTVARSIVRAEGWMDLGRHYTAVMTPSALPGPAAGTLTYIFYRVGDSTLNIWSPVLFVLNPPTLLLASSPLRSASAPPYGLHLIADTGIGTDDDSVAFRNRGAASRIGVGRMMADALGGWRMPILGTAVSGDLHYGDGLLATTAEHGALFGPLLSRGTFLWGVGNHEAAWAGQGGDMFERPTNSGGECNAPLALVYPMPRGATRLKPWYWAAVGSIAFVHVSTEHDFLLGSEQNEWLAAVLPALNRAVVPYIVVLAHRPMLVTSDDDLERSDGFVIVSGLLRTHVLPLLVAYNVTLVVAGHLHTYQRHCPVVPLVDSNGEDPPCLSRGLLMNVTLLAAPPIPGVPAPPALIEEAVVYVSPRAPVHVNVGNGGVELDALSTTEGAGTLERSIVQHGYTRLGVSPDGTTLDFEMVSFSDGSVLDRVRILQDVAGLMREQERRGGAWSLAQMQAGNVGRATAPPVLPSPNATGDPVASAGSSGPPGPNSAGVAFGVLVGLCAICAILYFRLRAAARAAVFAPGVSGRVPGSGDKGEGDVVMTFAKW